MSIVEATYIKQLCNHLPLLLLGTFVALAELTLAIPTQLAVALKGIGYLIVDPHPFK